MISPKYFVFLVFFLAACAQPVVDDGAGGNPFLEDPLFCNVDADCTCGGVYEGRCFLGNKLFASSFVDPGQSCPDFCSGIGGNLETRCVGNKCQLVEAEAVACPEDAKVCPDGSVVVRMGLDCTFPPCPGEPSDGACSADSDCVPASCCHPSECVPKGQAPDCSGVMCTMECRPGTLDCNGSCACVEGECSAVLNDL